MTDYADVYADQRDFLWGYCYRLTGSAADAEDLVQETFLKAYSRLDGFQHQSSFSTWLYRIAARHCLDILRKERRRKTEYCPV